MLQSYIGKTDWFFYILKVFILLSEEQILHQTGLFWIKKFKNKNKNKKNTKNIILPNPFQSSVVSHIEIRHLICTANRMTGFYVTQH